ARVLWQYGTMLDRLTAAPDQRLSAVPVGDATGRRLVVEEWNATAVDYPRDRTVHALIAEQAARTPDAVAVVHAGRTLTYAELDDQASRLAGRLQAAGVEPG